jgi:hypothetical protein
MAMEAKPVVASVSLDAINAYGDIERECIEVAIKENPYLHRLLPLYELLYKHGEGSFGITTKTVSSSWAPGIKGEYDRVV